jgi:hypothetical protein
MALAIPFVAQHSAVGAKNQQMNVRAFIIVQYWGLVFRDLGGLALRKEVRNCEPNGLIGARAHFSFRDSSNAFAAICKRFERTDFVGA